MSRTARLIIGGIIAVLVIVLISLVYIWVTGGSSAPSATLSAPTLELPTREPTEAVTETAADATTESTDAASANPDADNFTIFNIVADDSQVRFILDELLRGQPNTVTGRTNQIAGQFAVDFANPQASRVGEIRISARSLATDNELRNRAIRSQILQSAQDQFEFINFAPTETEGLPASITLGEPFEFQITGDLTIRDVTRPITFDVTVTPTSETELTGTATATVQRADFGLEIPSVPSVADVDEAVRLEIDFVAEAE